MVKKEVFILLLVLPTAFRSGAQMLPICQGGELPAWTCQSACVVCDLNGYSNQTIQVQPGVPPPGFCTQIVHNIGWIGFVAGSTNLSLTVDVGTCTLGNSIEMGIYYAPDCANPTLVSNCNTAMFQGNSYTFDNIEPLIPGCTYFLVFDNNAPASCPFTVNVTNGSATAPAPDQPAVPSGPNVVCPGATVTYTIPPAFGVCGYVWTAPPGSLINGMAPPVTLHGEEGTSVDVTFGNSGGTVCVRGGNNCYPNNPPSCLPVTVQPIAPTVLPPISICNGESLEWIDGNFYTGNQMMNITYASWLGCDSVVRQQLITRPPIVTNLGTQVICEGTCVEVGGNFYCDQGFYQVTLPSYLDCDSNVVFSVLKQPINAEIAPADTLDCLNSTVTLDGSGSTSGSNYAWYNSQNQQIGNQVLQNVNATGTYYLVVTRVAGSITCRDTAFVQVGQNLLPPLVTAVGDSMDCAGNPVQINGIVPDTLITLSWSGPGIDTTNQQVEDPEVSVPGMYVLTVTSLQNGCQASDTATVYFPGPPPGLSASADTLDCVSTANLHAESPDSNVVFSWTGPGNFVSSQADTLTDTPGWYFVRATSATGCLTLDSVEVMADTIPPDLAANGNGLNCADTLVQIAAVSQSGGLQFSWTGPGNFMANGQTVGVSIPGTYSVMATAANGCTATASASVSIDTLSPGVQASGGILNCQGNGVTLLGSSGAPGAAFAWSGPGNFSSNLPDPLVFEPGNYVLLVTGPNGCTASATALVENDANTPSLSIDPPDTLTCALLQTQLSVQSGTPGVMFNWTGPNNFTGTGNTVTANTPGQYTVNVMAPNGCMTTGALVVIQDIQPPAVSVQGDSIDCNQPLGNLSGSVVGPFSSVQWSGPGIIGPGGQLQIQVDQSGLYTLTVTGQNGCTASQALAVPGDFAVPNLVVQAPDTLTCSHPQSLLIAGSVTPGVQFAWTGPSGFSAAGDTVSTVQSGLYAVIVTAPNGCKDTAQVTLAQDTVSPFVSLMPDTLTCSTPEAFIQTQSADPALEYAWTGPMGFMSSAGQPLVSLPGSYLLQVTAANGCTAAYQVQVTEDVALPDLAASVSNVITCSQPESTLSGASLTPGVNYLWSGPMGFQQAGPVQLVDSPGIYVVTATGPNGCVSADTVTVDINTAVPDVFASGDTLDCLGSGVTLSGGSATPGVVFAWTGPANYMSDLPSPFVTLPGNYTLEVTAPNGCSSTAIAIVWPDDQAPDIVAGGIPVLSCNTPQGQLFATSGAPGVSFAWTGPNNFNQTGDTVAVNAPGVYTVVVAAANGCTNAATWEVLPDFAAPDVQAAGGVLTCQDTVVQLTGASLVGLAFSWTGPASFTSNDPSPFVQSAGQYTLTVTGPNGCTASQSALVSEDIALPDLSGSVSGILTCDVTEVLLFASSTQQGVAYSWIGPAGFQGSGDSVTVSLPGAYAVTALASNGCTATSNLPVGQDIAPPDVSAAGGQLDCLSPGVVLAGASSTPGAGFAWTGPSGFSSNMQSPLATQPGVYTLRVTGPNGCTATANVEVAPLVPAPQVSVAGGVISCASPLATLEATASGTGNLFNWTGPNGAAGSGDVLDVAEAGIYQVVLTAPNGCTSSAEVSVAADTLRPEIALSSGVLTCSVTQAEISGLVTPQGAALVWSGPVGGLPALPSVTVGVPGVYALTATAANGCSRTESVEVEAILPEWTIDLGPDTTVVSGSWLVVDAQTDLPMSQVTFLEWQPWYDCYDCLRQAFRADSTQLMTLTLVDENGCLKSDSVWIRVRFRNVYVPNIFSPNDDGENDLFGIYAGEGIDEIRAFRVFDRWGSMVFAQDAFAPGDPAGFWDGRFQGRELTPAVFVWVAEIVYDDGSKEFIKGDVTLTR